VEDAKRLERIGNGSTNRWEGSKKQCWGTRSFLRGEGLEAKQTTMEGKRRKETVMPDVGEEKKKTEGRRKERSQPAGPNRGDQRR